MSSTRRVLVAAGAGAALAAGRRAKRFYGRLRFETGEDERVTVNTPDGWELAMYRYRGRGEPKPFPVVAGHGFAGSRLVWDLSPQTSLAQYLSSQGFDFYALDLRGRGQSWPPSGPGSHLQWSFDDFVLQDLPAAVDAACDRSGAEGAFWLGLEMSGQALYAAAISGTATRVRGGVTFGSPALTPPSAHVPGVTTQPRMRRRGRVMFKIGSRYAGPLLAITRSKQLESSFRPSNCEPIVPARYLFAGVPDESTRLADQFADWIENGTMRSLDHSMVWSDRLNEVDIPLLVLAAGHDLQRPPDATRSTFESLGSADKSWIEASKSAGFSVDFGHDDLVAGRASRPEIFPRVAAWLEERSVSSDRSR